MCVGLVLRLFERLLLPGTRYLYTSTNRLANFRSDAQCVPGAAATTTTPAVTTAHTSSASGSTSTSTTGLNIRLLPLGDSITFGVGSSDGNGYRNLLHNLLSPGNTVDFIGSIKAGTMADNDNEGHSGYTITQISGTVSNSKALPARPNVR